MIVAHLEQPVLLAMQRLYERRHLETSILGMKSMTADMINKGEQIPTQRLLRCEKLHYLRRLERQSFLTCLLCSYQIICDPIFSSPLSRKGLDRNKGGPSLPVQEPMQYLPSRFVSSRRRRPFFQYLFHLSLEMIRKICLGLAWLPA